MIINELFYAVKCNRCGEIHNDGEYSFWNDECQALDNAYESDWKEVKGKHYCINCYETNHETDEVIIYECYPKHLISLNKFIDKVISSTMRNVFEDNKEFIVKFRLYNNPRLKNYEEDFIKQLLDDRLISLDYEDGKYNSHTCIIKFKK